MATYYFDANGATAGFGTLTGNWNPSTALWSTSSAGTSATAAVTFTNADVAQFGFTGTTGTAGTATITTGITNTVNQIVTANLAGGQTIAGPGTLDLAGTAPTINVGSAGGLTISAPITGTAGFTKSGTGTLNVAANNTGLTGTVTINAGTVNEAYTAGFTAFPNVSSFNVANAGATLFTYYSITGSIAAGTTYIGNGVVETYRNTTTAVSLTYPTGAFTGMTGTSAPSASTPYFPQSGLALYTDSSTSGRSNTVYVQDFPARVAYHSADAVNAATSRIFFTGPGATYATTQFDLITANSVAALSTSAFELYANNSNATPLVFGGGVTRRGVTGTMTFTLRGTSTANNEIQGAINPNSLGTLSISKADASKWILSGANTYTGTTSVSAGTLSAQNNTAFGTTGAVTQTGGTIEVTGGVALNKAGAALTLISAAGANALTSLTGSNTIACAGVTLSSTIIVDIASGADLTVNNTAAMSGAFGITKNNSGEFGLGTFANTYTGAVTIAAGTLTAGNLQNSGTASSLGTGALTSAIALTGTLKYNGTGHSTNRSITFTGSAPALDASGSGAATYSACTQAAGARTITFTGSSTAANTLSAALSDGTGAVSVTKSGAGKWVLSNATVNYTGTTSVSDGTLNFGGVNRTLSGAVSVSGGTIENSTNTLSANITMTGGTITAELTGNKTLDVNSGSAATLEPINTANSFSGATTVAAGGILRLVTAANPTTAGAGKVLGTSNVSVSGDLKTSAAGLQRGQMRYGGNLTFNSGAKFYVGGA